MYIVEEHLGVDKWCQVSEHRRYTEAMTWVQKARLVYPEKCYRVVMEIL